MSNPERISIIVPAYNEAEVLPHFHVRLGQVLDSLGWPAEVLYVNDGSQDATLGVLAELQRGDTRVAILDLSRNFGKEIAVAAGLDHATGAIVVVIDADLQDPPELIPALIDEWRNGYDVVYATRLSREGESWLKKATANAFYRLIGRVSHVDIPKDTGDFRLLSRRAVEALTRLREQHRFMKGLYAWIGYPQKSVPYHRDARYAGVTKWNYWRLWNFALEGITSFTTAPLKIAMYLGFAVAVPSFLFAGVIVVKTLLFGDAVKGYPSLMTAVLLLGGVQLLSLGVIGEYLGRMFNESKQRPLYFLREYRPADVRPNVREVA